MKNNLALILVLLASAELARSADILVCTSKDASEEIRQAAADLAAKADAPFITALRGAGGSMEVLTQQSEDLLEPKAYDRAAYTHLIVIGRPSQDALMQKVLGQVVGLDEGTQRLQSLGWGQLQGDLGWIESDRNPFLHSRRIKSAPEGTLLVKITGTTDQGILAALRAFEQGQLNGIVAAGPITRPKTTLLDLDPLPAPASIHPPQEISIAGSPAYLAGWSQVPAQEYRAVLEATGSEPSRMWRYKYFTPGFLGKKSIERWLSGPHQKALGNAFEIIEFADESTANQAVLKMTREGFKTASAEGFKRVRVGPQATDEVVDKPIWDIVVLAAGRYVILSTLPLEQTATLAQPLQAAAP